MKRLATTVVAVLALSASVAQAETVTIAPGESALSTCNRQQVFSPITNETVTARVKGEVRFLTIKRVTEAQDRIPGWAGFDAYLSRGLKARVNIAQQEEAQGGFLRRTVTNIGSKPVAYSASCV